MRADQNRGNMVGRPLHTNSRLCCMKTVCLNYSPTQALNSKFIRDIVFKRNCIRLGHYKLESNQSKVDKMCRRRSSYVILGFYPLFLINNLLYHCFLFYGSKNYWLQYKGKGVNNLVSFIFVHIPSLVNIY